MHFELQHSHIFHVCRLSLYFKDRIKLQWTTYGRWRKCRFVENNGA